nr:hypothetical protein [Tanacetum cinerariifolium]
RQRELEARSLIPGEERASLLDQVMSLKISNTRLRGTMMMESVRADRFWRCVSFMESKLRQICRFRYYDRMRFRRLETFTAENQSQNGSDDDNGNDGNRNGGDENGGNRNGRNRNPNEDNRGARHVARECGLSQLIRFLIKSSDSHIFLLRFMGIAHKNSTILLNTRTSLKGFISASLVISHSHGRWQSKKSFLA